MNQRDPQRRAKHDIQGSKRQLEKHQPAHEARQGRPWAGADPADCAKTDCDRHNRMNDPQCGEEMLTGLKTEALLGKQGVGQGSDSTRRSDERHPGCDQPERLRQPAPSSATSSCADEGDRSGKSSQEEERAHQMNGNRNSTSHRGIVGDPFGQNDDRSDKGFSNNGNTGEDDRQTNRMPGQMCPEDPNHQDCHEEKRHAAHCTMGKLDCCRTAQLGHQLALAGGPRPPTSGSRTGGSNDRTEKNGEDVPKERQPAEPPQGLHE